MGDGKEIYVINFDDVGEYLYDALTTRGYVPDSDTMLDLTDVVMDFITFMLHDAGADVMELGEDDM